VTFFFRLYYSFFGLVFGFAFAYDFVTNSNHLADFFSYFTVLSIFLAAATFLYLGFFGKRRILDLSFDEVRPAMVSYILISAAIYQFSLAGRPDINPVLWVDFVYHKLAPIVSVFGWLIFPPAKKINYRAILPWFVFPAIYVTLVFVRGFMTGWYPYYFFDPAKTGYFAILRFSSLATIFGLAVSYILVFIGNLLVGVRSKK